jgi:beta-1,4-mannosyltransferase
MKADAIHIMCEDTASMVEPYYPLPPEKVHVIPHSSYVGLYPDSLTQDLARRSFNLQVSPDSVVLLFFGLLRHYKGVTDLIDAYERVIAAQQESGGTNFLLIIAGEPFMSGKYLL